MKTFLAIILAFLSSTALAQNVSGVYYNPDANGEGISITHNEEQGKIAWMFYTYNPPEETCLYVEPVIIDEVVFIEEREECFSHGNDSAWYTGSDSWDGSAIGFVYASEAYFYPLDYLGDLADTKVVGYYILTELADGGMFFIITPYETGDAPETLYRAYDFNTLLIKPEYLEAEPKQ
jgi:hypothetical protein